ncbi:hypothetical protein SAMN05661093_02623 [Kibdelosporangium aridum]|uniref:Uncharacterized protein n=1 Tax=Kibdelosporangium aridum TaxID=2030 RepID=A0A1Y5XF13_KIBAR|nr:hypothetical protein SAMN05661093_02623 [Kibdelosporangium aridum]
MLVDREAVRQPVPAWAVRPQAAQVPAAPPQVDLPPAALRAVLSLAAAVLHPAEARSLEERRLPVVPRPADRPPAAVQRPADLSQVLPQAARRPVDLPPAVSPVPPLPAGLSPALHPAAPRPADRSQAGLRAVQSRAAPRQARHRRRAVPRLVQAPPRDKQAAQWVPHLCPWRPPWRVQRVAQAAALTHRPHLAAAQWRVRHPAAQPQARTGSATHPSVNSPTEVQPHRQPQHPASRAAQSARPQRQPPAAWCETPAPPREPALAQSPRWPDPLSRRRRSLQPKPPARTIHPPRMVHKGHPGRPQPRRPCHANRVVNKPLCRVPAPPQTRHGRAAPSPQRHVPRPDHAPPATLAAPATPHGQPAPRPAEAQPAKPDQPPAPPATRHGQAVRHQPTPARRPQAANPATPPGLAADRHPAAPTDHRPPTDPHQRPAQPVTRHEPAAPSTVNLDQRAPRQANPAQAPPRTPRTPTAPNSLQPSRDHSALQPPSPSAAISTCRLRGPATSNRPHRGRVPSSCPRT